MDKPVAGLALEVTLPFLKMHGAGNDFMVLDLRQNGDPSVVNANAVTHWADRRTGVGFDQLLVLTPGDRETSSARITIWNADGSSAEQCGNGMRCIGLYLAEHDGLGTDPISIDSAAGPLELRHRGGDQVSVRMGRPRFDPGEIPLNLTPETTGEYRLDINGTSLRFGALSMGNPTR